MQSAGGFLSSGDGGHTFEYRFPQIDTRIDTVITYGNNRLRALPAAEREEAPPYDVAIDPSTGDVWVAGWSTGIRRSSDKGDRKSVCRERVEIWVVADAVKKKKLSRHVTERRGVRMSSDKRLWMT